MQYLLNLFNLFTFLDNATFHNEEVQQIHVFEKSGIISVKKKIKLH